MLITFVTLFPEMFSGPLTSSIMKRAVEKDTVSFRFVNIRDFSRDRYGTVDGRPYGGGTGMILRVDVVEPAIRHAVQSCGIPRKRTRIILTDAGGERFSQKHAVKLTAFAHLVIVCGHYEGMDERIASYTDERISIGDFIVTGGELPAMMIADAVVRLLPGVLRSTESVSDESFSAEGCLEYPQYTRPETYKRKGVPKVLLSGNHALIRDWRRDMAAKRTKKNRPDLVRGG